MTKRKQDDVEERKLCFYAAPVLKLPEILRNYLSSGIAQSARFDEQDGCYVFTDCGREFRVGGLLKYLERQFYPHYKVT
jgi:hypothetical protein